MAKGDDGLKRREEPLQSAEQNKGLGKEMGRGFVTVHPMFRQLVADRKRNFFLLLTGTFLPKFQKNQNRVFLLKEALSPKRGCFGKNILQLCLKLRSILVDIASNLGRNCVFRQKEPIVAKGAFKNRNRFC